MLVFKQLLIFFKAFCSIASYATKTNTALVGDMASWQNDLVPKVSFSMNSEEAGNVFTTIHLLRNLQIGPIS